MANFLTRRKHRRAHRAGVRFQRAQPGVHEVIAISRQMGRRQHKMIDNYVREFADFWRATQDAATLTCPPITR